MCCAVAEKIEEGEGEAGEAGRLGAGCLLQQAAQGLLSVPVC